MKMDHTGIDETAVVEPGINLDNLYPAPVQCFGIILLGYIAGKFSFINDVESKGLSTFVGTFSLPALIFVSLCQLDFSSVNWLFLAAIFIAKATVFFSVLFVSIFMHRPFDSSKSGLYAIFCTQSNDFALGYPVLQAIYGTSHPEYPMYLYLIAPVSLVILNPIGFVFMEIGKNRSEIANDTTALSQTRSKWQLSLKVFLSIVKNPIIFMTVLGIVGNLLFHGSMPAILHSFLSTLGSAFSASALFLLGLRMVGQSSESTDRLSIITPLVLVVIKSLVLPLVTREVISQLNVGTTDNETLDLSNYGFLYGTIPTAPSVFVVLMVVVPDETPEHGGKVNFQYGMTQAGTALVMLIIRYKNKSSLSVSASGRETDQLLSSSSSSSDVSSDGDGPRTPSPLIYPAPPIQDEPVDVEDLILNNSSGSGGHCSGSSRYRCDSMHQEYCGSLIGHYQVPPAEDSLTARRATGGLEQNSADLVSWLKERGLAHTRQEAASLGRLLLRGRVLRHVDNHLDFYDDKFIYTFSPETP